MKNLSEDLEFQTTVSFSSMALHQARFAVLDAVVNNSKYKFDDSSKAILCTIFEQTMDWIHEVYIALRGSQSTLVNDYVAKTLIEKFRQCSENATSVVRMRYPNLDPKLAVIFMVISKKYHEHLVYRISLLLNNTTIMAFSDLNNFLVQYLNHIRIIMHEMDYLLFSSRSVHSYDPFVTIDLLDLLVHEDRRTSMPAMRLGVYMESKYFQDKQLCIKSYVESTALESNPKLNAEYEAILDSFEALGMEIVCIL